MVQMVKNLPAMQETQVWSLGLEDPLEKGMQPTPVAWWAAVMGLKESDTTERLTLLLTATVAVLGEALLGIVWSSLHGLSYFTTTCGEWLLLLHSFYRLQKAKKGKERLGTCAEVHKVGKVMD